MKKVIILNIFIFLLSVTVHSQQLTKELIIPNKYEINNNGVSTYSNKTSYYKHFDIDDSTFLIATHFADKNFKKMEQVRPVIYKIRNTKTGFDILWQSESYLDTSFTAYFGDLVIDSDKIKAVFLYQKCKYSISTQNNIFYPFFIDIDLETGKLIDSVGYLADYNNDIDKLNSKICYTLRYSDDLFMKYDGKDVIIPMVQPIGGVARQFIKNISRTGTINKIEETEHIASSSSPQVFVENDNNYYQYLSSDNGASVSFSLEFYSDSNLQCTDTLMYVKHDLDGYSTGNVLSGTGISNGIFRIFLNYSDKTRNSDRVYAGYYNKLGRIKIDTLMTNDIQFSREYATIDDEGTYYLSGTNYSDNSLKSFQINQYKNHITKSLVWKKDSIGKYLLDISPLKNDKAIALGMIYDMNKLVRSFYIAEIDFSLANSVMEQAEHLNLSVSPNPAEDFITIKQGAINPTLKRGVDETTVIYIYNTLGERVMTVEQTFLSVQQINISDLPKGMYFVKIDGEIAKFVKM